MQDRTPLRPEMEILESCALRDTVLSSCRRAICTKARPANRCALAALAARWYSNGRQGTPLAFYFLLLYTEFPNEAELQDPTICIYWVDSVISYMKKIIASIYKKLVEEKKSIEERLRALTKRSEDTAQEEDALWKERGQKTDENAAEVAEYADSLSVTDSLSSRLSAINQGLDAIKKNTYGICEVCKKHIEDARLNVMPTATRCMKCAQKK